MGASSQQAFAAQLLADDPDVPAFLARSDGGDPGSRFEVYRNNVRSALASALASRFPAAERVTGPVFFRAMALHFALRHPPRSPLLLDYGEDMPDFVVDFEPALSLPYLPDLMRFELLRATAYHAADEAALDPARLSSIPPEDVESLRFRLHSSAGLLRSAYPVLTIWQMNSGERPLEPISAWSGEDVLVVRPDLELHHFALPPGSAVFLAALSEGATLGEGAARAAHDSPAFDLHQALALALSSGVLAAFRESRNR